MEHLLSVSFDHLASFDGQKIKKGLRQIDGLLAQVCLSAHESAAARNNSKQHNARLSPTSATPAKKSRYSLSDLGGDAAFREFFKLQDGFEWNIATRLVQTLDKLYAKSDDGSLDLLIVSALDSLQGVLLLHPPSRVLFSRVQNMNVRFALFCSALLCCGCALKKPIISTLLHDPKHIQDPCFFYITGCRASIPSPPVVEPCINHENAYIH